jgi:superfamily II DNA or RNA helicase
MVSLAHSAKSEMRATLSESLKKKILRKVKSYIEKFCDRDNQKKAILAIIRQLVGEELSKCLVKMFCGSGKSRVIIATIISLKKKINVVVVPSLALVQQFYDDYLRRDVVPKELQGHAILNVSSKTKADLLGCATDLEDIKVDCTTEPSVIKEFLRSDSSKIICVTYQSLNTLIENLDGLTIGLACFDEAHNSVGETYKELIYNTSYYDKQVFFTATPVNRNGITMYDREQNDMGTYGDCGPLDPDCHYTYLNGLRDDVLSLFNIRIDMSSSATAGDSDLKGMSSGTEEAHDNFIYESIARTILASGNSRVLTFHKDVSLDSDSDTSVLRFVEKGKKVFESIFNRICRNEFPEKVGHYQKITVDGLTAKRRDKKSMLTRFGKCKDNEIFILASCGTIGEGVDTKNANMTVFVDPKTSVRAIIQNIGRICRKIKGTNRPAATVLIPVWVDTEKYRACGDDVEKRDEVLREQLNLGDAGDYNAILNVCAALQQEDPELYDSCLRYPSKFTEAERKHTLKEQGYQVDQDAEPLQQEDIQEFIEEGRRVEIHTDDPESPIQIHNDDSKNEESVCVYADMEDVEEGVQYYPIVPIEEKSSKKPRDLKVPTMCKRPKFDCHTNDELRLYWNVADDTDFSKKMGSRVIQCQLETPNHVENWKNNRKDALAMIDAKEGKALSVHSKDEYTQATWVSYQKWGYDPRGAEFSKNRMTTPEIWEMWKDTLADPKYSEALKRQTAEDPVQHWKNKKADACKLIMASNKDPKLRTIPSRDLIEGNWIAHQKRNYDPRCPKFSLKGMKNSEIWKIWTDTLADPEYMYALADEVQYWKNKRADVCKAIVSSDTEPKLRKRPSERSKDPIEKSNGYWITLQKQNYNQKGPIDSKGLMKNPEIWEMWKDTLADPKYSEALKQQTVEDPVQHWKNKKADVCKLIVASSKDLKLRTLPSRYSNSEKEKSDGNWIGEQKKNYDPRGPKFSTKGMKNSEIWEMWKDTLENPEYMYALKPGGNRIKKTKPTEQTIQLSPEPEPKKKRLIRKKPVLPESASKPNVLKPMTCVDKPSQPSQIISSEPRIPREQAQISLLHKEYKTMRSDNLAKKFQEQPNLWHEYHTIAEDNEAGFPDGEVPYQRVISWLKSYLAPFHQKKQKTIVDLGCGTARVHREFMNRPNLIFHNLDHVACDERVQVADISHTGLEDGDADVAILCLAMWGSNKEEYLTEAHRILDPNGRLIIIEPTKRWINDDGVHTLSKMLEQNGFKIEHEEVKTDEDNVKNKFSMFVVSKININKNLSENQCVTKIKSIV